MKAASLGCVEQIVDWLRDGHATWLSTVIQTWGSSPRPVGSWMAFAPGQGAIGSVSGGCIEESLFDDLSSGELADRASRSQGPWRIRYGHQDGDQQRFALPCGGQLHLLLEHLQPVPETVHHFEELARSLRERRACQRQVCLHSGRLDLRSVNTRSVVQFDERFFQHTLPPQHQLLLVGLGEVTRYAADFARQLGFAVTVVDMRPAFLSAYPIPEVEVLEAAPDELIRQRFSDTSSAIMTLSHDPRLDDLALMEALNAKPFFIGAMGSVQTSLARKQRLQDLGFDEAQVSRIKAPLGLPIGSKTPVEIALSAVSQLVEIKNQSAGTQQGRRADGYSAACHTDVLR